MARRPRPTRPGRRPGQGNLVRIIGGEHGGRRLHFPSAAGLRPTADRVRETLFNWLQPCLPGSRCLDLFAGSGALGLEAASRGAAGVVLLEREPRVARRLRENVELLGLKQVSVVEADALNWLRTDPRQFDILFLDPPFGGDLMAAACRLLAQGHWLAPGARIYLEMDASSPLPPLPREWRPLRKKRAGQVCYYLFAGPE